MPNILVDFDLRRFYEVPQVAYTTTVLAGGYLRLTPTVAAPSVVDYDVVAEIYSEWVRQREIQDGDYAPLAFRRSGGEQTGTDEFGATFATTELFLRNDYGWKIVLANYPHAVHLNGNLRPQNAGLEMFDFQTNNVFGAYPLIERASNLIVRTSFVDSGSGLTSEQAAQLAKLDNFSWASGNVLADVRAIDAGVKSDLVSNTATGVWGFNIP